MRYILIFFLLFYVLTSSSSQENDTIFWTSQVRLKWNDFNFNIADTCYKQGAEVMTHSSIDTKGFWDKGLPNYQITVCFLRSLSCTIDTLSQFALEHEQLHFDIAELYARKMRQTVKSLRFKHEKNFNVYSSSFKNIDAEQEQYQDRYDLETHHGNMVIKQKEWIKKVKGEMDKLKLYSSDNILK